jgi:hypothetical protein
MKVSTKDVRSLGTSSQVGVAADSVPIVCVFLFVFQIGFCCNCDYPRSMRDSEGFTVAFRFLYFDLISATQYFDLRNFRIIVLLRRSKEKKANIC